VKLDPLVKKDQWVRLDLLDLKDLKERTVLRDHPEYLGQLDLLDLLDPPVLKVPRDHKDSKVLGVNVVK